MKMENEIKKALKALLQFDGDQDKCSECGADDWKGKKRIHDDCNLGNAIEILESLIKGDKNGIVSTN